MWFCSTPEKKTSLRQHEESPAATKLEAPRATCGVSKMIRTAAGTCSLMTRKTVSTASTECTLQEGVVVDVNSLMYLVLVERLDICAQVQGHFVELLVKIDRACGRLPHEAHNNVEKSP